MKSTVIVCCVFVFCSKFVACIPYPEDLARYLGAYPPLNAPATAPQQIPYSNIPPRSPNINNIAPNPTLQEILNQQSFARQRNDYTNLVLANQPSLVPQRTIPESLSPLQVQQPSLVPQRTITEPLSPLQVQQPSLVPQRTITEPLSPLQVQQPSLVPQRNNLDPLSSLQVQQLQQQQLGPLENAYYETSAQLNQPNTVGEPYLSSVPTIQDPQLLTKRYLLPNQIQPQYQGPSLENAPSIQYGIPVKIKNQPINQEQITPNIRNYIKPLNPLIRQQIINQGFNPTAILSNPNIQETSVPIGTKKRYLVIHPNGTVEHLDKLAPILKQNPNYVLYNGQNFQPKPTFPIPQLVNATLATANATASVKPLFGPLKNNTNNSTTTIRPPTKLKNQTSTIKPSINVTWIVVTPKPLNVTVKNSPLNVTTIQPPIRFNLKNLLPINITLAKPPNKRQPIKPSIKTTFAFATASTNPINVPLKITQTPRPSNYTTTPKSSNVTSTTPKPQNSTTTVRSSTTQHPNTTPTAISTTSTTTQNPNTTPSTTSTTSTTTSRPSTTQNPPTTSSTTSTTPTTQTPTTTPSTSSTTSTTTSRPSTTKNPTTTPSTTSTTPTTQTPTTTPSTSSTTSTTTSRPSTTQNPTTTPSTTSTTSTTTSQPSTTQNPTTTPSITSTTSTTEIPTTTPSTTSTTSTTTSRPTTTQNPTTTPSTTSTTSTTTSRPSTTQNPTTTSSTTSTTSTTTSRPSTTQNPTTTPSSTSTTTTTTSRPSTTKSPNTNTTPSSAANPAKQPVVWFRTTDPDFFNKVTGGNETYDIVQFFQVSPQPIIEKDIKKTIHPNGTIVEELTETIYEDKEDPNPTIKKTTNIIHP